MRPRLAACFFLVVLLGLCSFLLLYQHATLFVAGLSPPQGNRAKAVEEGIPSSKTARRSRNYV